MSFSKSSNNISMKGSTLRAYCKGISGGYTNSSINLDNYVGNNNGNLEWGGKNFSHSSDNISVSGSTLYAKCRRIDGTYNQSSLNLDKYVGNSNGKLFA